MTPTTVRPRSNHARSRAARKAPCRHCGEMFSETGLGHHEAACADPSRRGRKRESRRVGFVHCPRHPERLMPKNAGACFLCEELDANFAACERRLAGGVVRPRAAW